MATSVRARNLHPQTARHNGRILPLPANGRKAKMNNLPTLLEAWLAVRNLSLLSIAESGAVARGSIYNLLEAPETVRARTLDAIAEAVAGTGGKPLTGPQIAVLASRRVKNPDRVSEEIEDALASIR